MFALATGKSLWKARLYPENLSHFDFRSNYNNKCVQILNEDFNNGTQLVQNNWPEAETHFHETFSLYATNIQRRDEQTRFHLICDFLIIFFHRKWTLRPIPACHKENVIARQEKKVTRSLGRHKERKKNNFLFYSWHSSVPFNQSCADAVGYPILEAIVCAIYYYYYRCIEPMVATHKMNLHKI